MRRDAGGSKLRGAPLGEFDHLVWVTMKRDGPVLPRPHCSRPRGRSQSLLVPDEFLLAILFPSQVNDQYVEDGEQGESQ